MSRFNARTGEAAALERWALTPRPARAAATSAARDAVWRGYERRVDPDSTLDEGERYRRASALQRAHMLRMVEARRLRRAATQPDA